MISDIRTDDGLRDALGRLPAEGGWDGPLGRRIVATLAAAARHWVRSHTYDVVDPHRREHLTGVAWEFVATNTSAVIAARSPWGLLITAMRHHAAAEALADELSTSARHAKNLLEEKVRARLPTPLHSAVRPGLAHETTATQPASSKTNDDPVSHEVLAHLEPDPTADWDNALRALYDELLAAGAPSEKTAAAIENVIDASCSTTSRSRMHTAVYRSTSMLDLTHAQRRALTELLIGTRRGGPEQSTWLAIRRSIASGEEPAMSTDVVAATRIARFASASQQDPASVRQLAMSA
ncbi:hypothetical protein G1H11_16075 [Phytoactinopolyspora alkaliphila]|uniref:Uncharacterized protein n=1 Tax=Phytoactinopolyspora alkaliphila TaxID=1783498 RepID=A0A6N9YP57_9ACTN|nr:hypothetical protein [Phytoactinopolyspora alkaliphila]NED96826.1 hypothetical protein [Phytoactinopolyspora alkaliphila]